ncbi:hypothetical protein NA78x_004426 [Anatilimnocola sp. NA78]|uniref:glycosyltransferase family 39 protein n=1 Tax=Anatilimnocola sp. NA78 TaxID=3415683 RepID=UPI003CE4B43B
MKSPPFLLIAAVIVGAALRWYQAGESLWVDELHTSWSVSGSLGEVYERAAVGNQSPLYFWLAWLFYFVPGPPEIALRLPSLLAGCVLPVAMYWLTKQLLSLTSNEPAQEKLAPDDTTPLLAAWLIVVDPTGIFYAQEARPYALVQLLAVIHIGLLCNVILTRNWQSRPLWIASGALLVHLHYTAALLLAAEAVAVLLMIGFTTRASDRRELVLARILDLFAMLLLVSPAISGMLSVAGHRDNWKSFVTPPTWEGLFTIFPWNIAAVALIVLNNWRSVIPQRAVIVIACWLFVPLSIAWFTTQLNLAPLFHARYLLAAWPASVIAAALCVRFARSENIRSALIGILLAIAVRNSGMIRNARDTGRLLTDRKENWRAAVTDLNEQLQAATSPVLLRTGFIETDELLTRDDKLFREYSVCPARGMYHVQVSDELLIPLTYTNPGQLSAEARQALIEHHGGWLLIRSSSATVRRELIEQLTNSIGSEYGVTAAEPREYGGVYLQRVDLKKREPATPIPSP